MGREIFEKIQVFLKNKKIKYNYFEHEKITSSEHAAKIREKLIGEHWKKILSRGAKAMIIKRKDEYFQLILPGTSKIDFKKIKKIIRGQPKLARTEEVVKVTSCVPNSVPPFGNIFGLTVYVDESLLKNKFITFNAGALDISIDIKTKDWLDAVQPIIENFTI